MYEVIWSYWHDCHVLRPVNVNSSVRPLFMGSREECAAWIVNNTNC